MHDLGEPNEPDVLVRGKWADLLPSIPEGENYLWHTDRGGGEPLFGWRRRYWSFLLKLAKDQPSWTIQAQPGPATGHFHWNNRRLSKVEMGRLQTFPRSVQIVGSIINAQKQLGNAVPSLLAEVLARQIAVQLLGAKRRHSGPWLALRPAVTPPPTPTAPVAVPRRFQALIGEHLAHPGTGQGARALARQLIAADREPVSRIYEAPFFSILLKVYSYRVAVIKRPKSFLGSAPPMHYWDVWVDTKGGTHQTRCDFKAFDAFSLGKEVEGIYIDKLSETPSAVWIAQFPEGWVGAWHENPKPQWTIPLSGRWFVETTDGHRVEMGPGDASFGGIRDRSRMRLATLVIYQEPWVTNLSL